MNSPGYQYQFTITKTVKWLIIGNVAVWFIFQVLLDQYFLNEIGGVRAPFTKLFELHPAKVILDFGIWRPFTYMFLHAISVSHLVLNMIMLWFIGSELEQRWGAKSFLIYYVASGAGAGLIYCIGVGIYSWITGGQAVLNIPVIGASGAVFGLLVAYGIIFGDRVLHFMMVFPMPAKYFVLLLGFMEILSLVSSGVSGSEVANLAHIGGIVSGYLSLISWTYWQRRNWNKKSKKKNSNLRLVVNNDPPKRDGGNGPKYWN